MTLFRSIQNRLIGKALEQCSDPFEEGRVIVIFNFSIVMIILTLPYIVISLDLFIGNFLSAIGQVVLLLFVIVWLNKGYKIKVAKNVFLSMFGLLHLYHFFMNSGSIEAQGVLFLILSVLFVLFLYGRVVGWIAFVAFVSLMGVGIYNTSTNYALFHVPDELADPPVTDYGQFIYVIPLLMITYLVSEFVGAQKKAQKRIYKQNKDLSIKNKEIHDSINYAKRIQSAILPPNKLIKEHLPNSFVLYKPKDIVAGDFYWLEASKNAVIFAAADCTGHGVPGAMVSVICNGSLNRSVNEFDLSKPSEILDKTRELVIQEFKKSEEEVKDGMDIALCALNGMKLDYAGAHNPLWVIRKGASQVEEIKADKQPIGKYAEPKPFTTHTVNLNPGDSFYIFSDGFADQFGGEKGKKYKSVNFKRLLLSVQNESLDRQKEIINEAFENWKGDQEQLDDICVIGVRV